MKVLHHVSGRNKLDILGQGLADINFDENVNMLETHTFHSSCKIIL